MNNDLISRSELTKELRERLVACNEWEEKAKDNETRIRANAVKMFLCEMFMLLKEVPTVEPEPYVIDSCDMNVFEPEKYMKERPQEEKQYTIKVNIPEDIKDKLVEELSKPRKVIPDESKTVTDCMIAYGDGFESARRLFERPQGEWIERTDTEWHFECNQCKGLFPWKAQFCGVCGADMRGDNNGKSSN